MDSVKVNDILKEEVVKVSSDFTTVQAPNLSTARLYSQKLESIVDELGARSAQEQKLKRTITSSEKLRNSDHILYLLNDPRANNGAGAAIGLLKVGRKKLFLYDSRQQVIEAEPLCVLDFFIDNSYQRHGLGKRLFDYMLQDQNTRPELLAIDGPSQPMTEFLSRHYGMTTLVKQNNNFAVAASFFNEVKHIRHHGIDRQAYIANNAEHQDSCPQAVQPATANFGRFAAHQRPSQMGNVIHGGGDDTNHTIAMMKSPGVMEVKKTSIRTAESAYDQNPPISAMSNLSLDIHHDGGGGDNWQRSQRQTPTLLSPNQYSHQSRNRVPSSCVSPAYKDRSRAGSVEPRNDSMMTEDGHMDLKFYHKKLW